MTWPVAFVLTLLIEVPIAVAVLGAFRLDRRRAAIAALIASTLTHPVLWVVRPGPAAVIAAEAVIVVVEAAVYRLVVPDRERPWAVALAVSTLANACSFAVGLVIAAVV